MLIPDKIVRLLEAAEWISLGTLNPDGTPSVANKFLLKCREECVVIVDFFKGRTRKNIQTTKKVSISIMDNENLVDYQLNGTGSTLHKGAEYKKLKAELEEKELVFLADRIIKGVRRDRKQGSFDLSFPGRAIFFKIKIDDIIELGPRVELKKKKVRMDAVRKEYERFSF